MAVKAEKMQECNSEVRRNGQQQQLMASEEMLKPEREKRKHLVAASLPSSQLPAHVAHAGGSGCQKSEQSQNLLLTCMMALNILLFSVLLFQKKQPNEQNFVHIDISSSPEQLYAAGKQGLEELPKSLPCSGHGHLITSQQQADASRPASAACKCHACYGGSDCSQAVSECIIDLDHGDPTMYEAYWLANGESSTTVIPGWQRMSYFAHSQQVWFMEHELEVQIRALHAIVGNAITEGRHIVVGTGSTQLYQAALYALSLPEEQTKPISVVSAAPFYSSYPVVTDYLRSALFRWAGDATTFKQRSGNEEAYIELVTSPNNPDGRIQHAVVNGTGPVIHDLAYYWPHYTPITAPADHDLMLFTVSKCTGHAGTRIGWAIVKDALVAKKMVKFVELNTIGVSQDSQMRAVQILRAVILGYNNTGRSRLQESAKKKPLLPLLLTDSHHIDNQDLLFHYGHSIMSYRWNQLRAAVASSTTFSLLDFSPDHCTFFGENHTPTPAFAWLRCNREPDCRAFLKARGIITRSGHHFGAGPEFVRVSMLERNHSFELVVQRLASLQTPD